MSILAEVIQSAETVDVEYINKTVPELKVHLETCKNEMVTTVENIYVKYSNRSKSNDILLSKVLQTQQTLGVLKDKAEYISSKDLVKCNQELSKNIDELAKIEFSLNIIKNLQSILKLIGEFDSELSKQNYIKCVEVFKELQDKYDESLPDETLDVITELKLTLSEKFHSFQSELKNAFTDNIRIYENMENTIILTIKKPNDNVKTAMIALYKNTEEIRPLNYLTKKFWDYFLTPIVNSEVVLTDSEDNTSVSLQLSIQNPDKKVHYKKVFEQLKMVLQFLLNNFNYEISENVTTLSYMGNDISHNLSELIIKNCLRDTIPSNAEELQNYKVVIEDTKELEKVLLDSKIFTEETSSILEYANKVDVLFVNKKCEEYVQKAISIMKMDLHDLVVVGVPYNSDFPLGQQTDFPQCCISKNVQQLLKLCEDILEEALQASPECSGRLFITVTNIVTKYPVFVSEFHKYYLSTLPQQIGLFFNNCQYIAYILKKWNLEYCSKLVHELLICNFTSEASQLPVMALDIFNNYLEGQVKQINEIMSGAQLDGPTIEKVDPKTEKCVRQCLRQQELLKTVWHKVLSYDLYNKYIGLIVDELCKSIINSIVKFEDIPARVAEQLVDVIKLVLTRAPKLFTDPKEITLFVPLWYKLNEVSFVLNASLVEINDRWADGKGPLALQFEADELKQLIKSLFQNTDRRAAVLERIKDSKT
ncbi:zeste-white 10 kinetochore protein [Rhynchophorus ferrugineus]|uniref:zeste-white 10 kinetochore protein n=1 Tax=Rhynchophorus ferrugineus TaxID=354439 RepID=UPI003FCC9D15